jgi:hypothetical protein
MQALSLSTYLETMIACNLILYVCALSVFHESLRSPMLLVCSGDFFDVLSAEAMCGA